MANQYINKVVYGGDTLIDISVNNDVEASDILSGKKTYHKSGAPLTGTCTFDADTSDATAIAGEILNTKTAYVNGSKVTGSMPNRGGATGSISTKTGTYSIQSGYHDGSGKVGISSTEQAKIIAGNIKSGVSILGVTGTYAGEAVKAQANKTATPYTDKSSIVLPDSGYDYLAQVTVEKIYYAESDNAAGGKTVTIGTKSTS